MFCVKRRTKARLKSSTPSFKFIHECKGLKKRGEVVCLVKVTSKIVPLRAMKEYTRKSNSCGDTEGFRRLTPPNLKTIGT